MASFSNHRLAPALLLVLVGFGCAPVSHRPAPIGDRTGELHLRLVGPHHNVIEAYFRNSGDLELFESIAPPNGDTTSLRLGDTVLVAPRNQNGLFTVTYGPHHDVVKAFGWKKGTAPVQPFELPGPSGHAVTIEWITPLIFKAVDDQDHNQQYVVRFNPNDDHGWQILQRP
jgi:hypothetical protein